MLKQDLWAHATFGKVSQPQGIIRMCCAIHRWKAGGGEERILLLLGPALLRLNGHRWVLHTHLPFTDPVQVPKFPEEGSRKLAGLQQYFDRENIGLLWSQGEKVRRKRLAARLLIATHVKGGVFDSQRKACIVICHSRVLFQMCAFYQTHAEACVLVLVWEHASPPTSNCFVRGHPVRFVGSMNKSLLEKREEENLNLNSWCLRQTRLTLSHAVIPFLTLFGFTAVAVWFSFGLGFFEIRADYRHYCFVMENCNQRMTEWNWTYNISQH